MPAERVGLGYGSRCSACGNDAKTSEQEKKKQIKTAKGRSFFRVKLLSILGDPEAVIRRGCCAFSPGPTDRPWVSEDVQNTDPRQTVLLLNSAVLALLLLTSCYH